MTGTDKSSQPARDEPQSKKADAKPKRDHLRRDGPGWLPEPPTTKVLTKQQHVLQGETATLPTQSKAQPEPNSVTIIQGELPGDDESTLGPSSKIQAADTVDTTYATIHELIDPEALRPQHERYIIDDQIGRGGMGIVMRCTDRDLRRPVAMKILRQDRARRSSNSDLDTRRIIRFIQEAQVTGQLEHPNIVPVHEFGNDEQDRPFFTMKLVDGYSLKEVIRELKEGTPSFREHFTQQTLLEIFLKVCDGMAFAHSRGVIHRDLKPANIMVGNFGEVLVMDWGLARLLDPQARQDDSGDSSLESLKHDIDIELTREGQAAGTPNYMSPEQAQGRLQHIDHRADIFALGAILFEMFAHRAPIKGPTPQATLDMARRGQHAELTSDQAPTEIRAIVAKAMHTLRDERYQSIGELATDIRRFRSGYSVTAKKDGLAIRVKKLVQRHKALSASITIASLILLLIGSWSWIQIRREQASTEAVRVELERKQQEELKPWIPIKQIAAIHDGEQAVWDEDLGGVLAGEWFFPTFGKRPRDLGFHVASHSPELQQGDGFDLNPGRRYFHRALILRDSVPGQLNNQSIAGNLSLVVKLTFRPSEERQIYLTLANKHEWRDTRERQDHRSTDFGSYFLNGYAVGIGERITLYARHIPVHEEPTPATILAGEPFTIGLEREDDEIRVYIDEADTPFFTWIDPFPRAGVTSTLTGLVDYNSEARIHHVTLAKQGFAKRHAPVDSAFRLLERGEYEEARHWFLTAAESSPHAEERDELLFQIGRTHHLGNRPDEAFHIYDTLLTQQTSQSHLPNLDFTTDPLVASKARLHMLLTALLKEPKQMGPDLESWSPDLLRAWDRFQASPDRTRLEGRILFTLLTMIGNGREPLNEPHKSTSCLLLAERVIDWQPLHQARLRKILAERWLVGAERSDTEWKMEKALSLDRASVMAYLKLIPRLLAQGRHQRGLELAKAYQKLRPQDPYAGWLVSLGMYATQAEHADPDYVAVRDRMLVYHRTGPEDIRYRQHLIYVLFQTGDLDLIKDIAPAYLNEYPRDEDSWLCLIAARTEPDSHGHLSEEALLEAVAYCDSWIATTDSSLAWLTRGQVQLTLGAVPEANASLEQAWRRANSKERQNRVKQTVITALDRGHLTNAGHWQALFDAAAPAAP